MSAGLRLDGDDKYIGLVVHETAHEALVLVSLRTLNAHALALTSYKVRLHVGRLSKDQFFCRDPILMGNLHEVGDGNIQLAGLYLLILFGTDADGLSHLTHGNVEHIAQSLQALAYLL